MAFSANHCAVCGRAFVDDDQIRAVDAIQVARTGPDVGRSTTVAVGAALIETAALGDRLPRDILFLTCGAECHDILTETIAIDDDRAQACRARTRDSTSPSSAAARHATPRSRPPSLPIPAAHGRARTRGRESDPGRSS